MNRFVTLLTLFLLIILFSCHKDDYSTADFGFTKTIDNGSNDKAKKIILVDNNLYVFGSANDNFYLLKLDTLGKIIYQKEFSSPTIDDGVNMILSNDNNLILTGTSISGGNRDIKVIKSTIDGNVIWEHTYGTLLDESVGGITQTAQGNYCLSATKEVVVGNKDVYLLWINDNGDKINEQTYGGALRDGGMEVLNVNSNLVVLAYTNSYGAGGQDYMLIKVNEQGDSIWAHTYGGDDYEESQEFVQLQDGSFIINGHSKSTDPMHNMFAVKTDANGIEQWSKNFGGAMHDGGEAILLNSKGNIVLVGRSMSFGNGERNIYIVEIDANGNLVSEKPIITPTYDWATSIVELNGYYYITGYTQLTASDQTDVFLLKIKTTLK